jgi:hypothetical protein
LYRCEDVCDGDLGGERDGRSREGIEGGLDVVRLGFGVCEKIAIDWKYEVDFAWTSEGPEHRSFSFGMTQ